MDDRTTAPDIPPFSRTHTFQAARLLFRPGEMDSSSYHNVVADLLDDILADRIDLKALDVDGSTVVSLALRRWSRWPQDLSDNTHAPPGFSRYPLPGVDGRHHDPRYIHDWQQPAAALIWKGADPFQQWPHDDMMAWSRISWDQRIPKCGVLAAIRYKAWSIVDLCLRHPDCPGPEAFDKLFVHGGSRLLHAVAKGGEGIGLLLNHGLNPNVVDSNGRTSLFAAESHEAVEELLKGGADPHHVDNDGNDAPTYWGKKFKDSGAFIEIWNRHSGGKPASANGRMVAQTIQSSSWKTMRGALKASGWSPDQPVDPNRHPDRRLPKESVLTMLFNLRGAGLKLPLVPLSKLFTERDLRDIWTLEEKAWVACSLILIQGAEKMNFAFSQGSMVRLPPLLESLLGTPGVSEKVAPAFGAIMKDLAVMDGVEMGKEIRTSLWGGWMSMLPLTDLGPDADLLDADVNGINSLAFLGEESDGLLKSLAWGKTKAWGSSSKLAESGFSGANEAALQAFLRMRAMAGAGWGAELSSLDQAWREAWDALPGRPVFTGKKDGMRFLISEMMSEEEPESWAHAWSSWIHGHEMNIALPQEQPRLRKPGRF